MTKLAVIVTALAGVALAAISIVETSAEVLPYLAGGISVEQRFASIASGDLRAAGSRWSKDLFVSDCLEVPRSPFALAQQAAHREMLLSACRDEARNIVSSVPTKSSAWMVIATTSADLGDFAIMRSSLAISRATAPKLRWLADIRSALAERYPTELDSVNRAGYEDDIAVLASGADGVEVLAQRYVRHPERRDLYARIVETAGVDQQRQFLSRVKFFMAALQ